MGARKGDAAEAAILEFVDFQFEVKDRGPRKESLSDRARRASGGGRVETVRKDKPEGGEGEESREAAPRQNSRPASPPPNRQSPPKEEHPKGR